MPSRSPRTQRRVICVSLWHGCDLFAPCANSIPAIYFMSARYTSEMLVMFDTICFGLIVTPDFSNLKTCQAHIGMA